MDKENDVYIPLLTAFINEIKRQYQVHKDIPGKLVEYLLGKHDFYKIISMDRERTTQIQSYNLRGTLNQNSESEQASIQIPVASLPTRIVSWILSREKQTLLSFIWTVVGNSLFAYIMQKPMLCQL